MQQDIAHAHVDTLRVWSAYWHGDAIAENRSESEEVSKLLGKASDLIESLVGLKIKAEPSDPVDEAEQFDAFKPG